MKKRAFALFLVTLLIVFPVGCGKKIELTSGNIKSYLSISMEYSKPVTHTKNGVTFAESNVSIKMYPVKDGSFENVEFTVVVSRLSSSLWTVSSSDRAYDSSNEQTLTCKIKLPASGTYTETHTITGMGYAGIVIDPSIGSNLTIKDVSGVFIPNN